MILERDNVVSSTIEYNAAIKILAIERRCSLAIKFEGAERGAICRRPSAGKREKLSQLRGAG